MRILMLTQWFEPEPAFKGLQFARRLKDLGHDVEVLTGFPNYPVGKLYPDYRIRCWQKELMDGIPVVRVPLYASHDRSVFRRALNYLSFAIAATLLGPWLVRRPDVIYAYHPPGTVALPALVLKLWFSAPVVYDVQDLWPDTITSSGMLRNQWSMRLLDRLCRFAYRSMDRVVVLSPGFQRALMDRGVSADRLQVVYNWSPDPDMAAVAPSDAAGVFTVVYAGTMGPAQDLDAVLDAADRLRSTAPAVKLLLIGGGVDFDRLKCRAAEMRLPNVEFRVWMPPEEVRTILSCAGALLVHLKDDPLFAVTIPSKTQTYLAAGRPIVMAVRGDAATLVAASGSGVLAEPGNPDSIANAIRAFALTPAAERDRMGKRGREFYEKYLSIDIGLAKLAVVLESAHSERVGAGVPERVGS